MRRSASFKVVMVAALTLLVILPSGACQKRPDASAPVSAPGASLGPSSIIPALTTIPASVQLFPMGSAQSGDMAVQLFSDHNPPSIYDANLFDAIITDTQGQPVLDASVVFIANMPGMDMGRNEVSAVLTSSGHYAGLINYSMLGLWRVTVNIYRQGHTTNVDIDFNINP